MRSTNTWLEVLLRCGVRMPVALDWSPIFAEVIADTSFSGGDAELVAFLGQILEESHLLQHLEEDLYYSTPGRLMVVWPSRFHTFEEEKPYLKNPQALADKVYSGRMGNTNPGDGWKYRGSGLIMVTGADNLKALQTLTGIPVYDNPELLRKPTVESLKVCIAWWEGHVPDSVMGNIKKVTLAVNGGLTGLAERIKLTGLALEALA
jgi:putative chitinase